MAGIIELLITAGKKKGRKFVYQEPDTFVFGRMNDCHVRFPDDNYVSRHHFILEVNPPDARIRDLGSLNGTHINGNKIGCRLPHETPEEGARRYYPEIDLKNGDDIKVGRTKFKVIVVIPDGIDSPIKCQRCGKDVSNEATRGRIGEYVCEECRRRAENEPSMWINRFLNNLISERDNVDGFSEFPRIGLQHLKFKRKLGSGGFGVVYLLQNHITKDKVAIKMLLPRIAADQKHRQLFLREMEVFKHLPHENIVKYIDFGSHENTFYILMEYCEGGNVDDLINRRGGKLSQSESLEIISQALEGMTYIHQKRYVHRDLKPSNILLSGTGRNRIAKITDMGLAKNYINAGYSGLTYTGAFAGTFVYMPSEQITNFRHVKPSSDVWSMGAVLYHMLTGNSPRDFLPGRDPIEIVLRGKIVPVRQRDPSVPRDLARVIDRSLSINVEDRYQNAGEMLRALRKTM